jgi:tetratricopeptide (TPR) repeat protein
MLTKAPMPPTSSRRRLVLSAAIALTLWLVAVVTALAWVRPEFWLDRRDRFQRAEELARERRWVESVAWVDRALADEPHNVGYLVFKGYRQLDLEDAPAAEETFRRALREDPSHVEAQLGFARALAEQGKRADAIAALMSLSAETMDAAELRRRSSLYSTLGARELALDDIALLLHADPNNPELLKEATRLSMEIKDWDRAATLSLRLGSATSNPVDRKWAAERRAEALEARGRPAEAYESYVQADNPDRLETRAYLALRLRRYRDAARLYAELAQQHPEEPRFRRTLAFALQSAGRLQDAARVFRDLEADGLLDPATRQAYAWLLNRQRRYAEAWRVLEPLPRPSPDPELLELQTRTAIWAERPNDAIPLIRALLEVRPADVELWKRLADAWQQLGDDPQAVDALRAYARLQSQDWQTRQRLAGILARIGRLEEAIAEYSALVTTHPANQDLRRSLGLLYETGGQLDAALDHYLRVVEQSPTAAVDLALRIARLYRWTSRPQEAVGWYERYLGLEPDLAFRREAESELALSLLDSGNAVAAVERLRAAAAQRSLDADELLTAARANTAIGQPATAARYLELLAERRALTEAEETWLADQYRAAGHTDRALVVYERIAKRNPSVIARVVEAVGDLRYDLGDFAGALRAFRLIKGVPTLDLKIARVAARAGELNVAAEGYETYVRAHPNDIDARLEAARYHASAGRSQLAIDHYQQYVAGRGATGLRLELARVHLAAEQFADAEKWAREALSAGENRDEAQLALGQSLHLQGREDEASTVLGDLLRRTPGHPEGLAWLGYVAAARDRHLDVYRFFERAIATGVADRGSLLLLQGTAARKRGDFARAFQSYSLASTAASPAMVDAARRDLRDATQTQLYIPVGIHGDTNGLLLRQAGGGALIFVPSGWGSVSFEGAGGRVSQRSFSSNVTSATLRVADLFPTPELTLDLAVGLDAYDRAADFVNWRASATYEPVSNRVLGLVASRHALLALNPRRELRQFNRVLDIDAIGPGFFAHGISGFADLMTRGSERTRIELGWEGLQDGNARTFAYGHYQIPLTTGVRHWSVVRPNLFAEMFRDKRPFYYSPSSHLTLGTMYHLITQYPRWSFEFEMNPQLLYTEGVIGFGAHGLVNLDRRIRRVRVGAGTFVFYDGLENHVQWRVGGRITVPLGW